LSYWSEDPPEEAEFISLTLGSLGTPDLRDLEESGWLENLLGDEGGGEGEVGEGKSKSLVPQSGGLPWFETMVEGSKLGKMRRSMGTKTAENGRYRVEWEVVEWTGDGDKVEGDNGEAGMGKRKLGDLEVEDHEEMEGVHSER
jgi:hypothetical protein